ncbi:site-specific integrase [Changpingibacter yushuensis]|uniref:site-specific integrase n=1 Tax=Changpingibacter yushuensis TaxID=2758440 RepID=UPI00248434D7|nr:site-specific integrase [Changpingibacter yushuensis]
MRTPGGPGTSQEDPLPAPGCTAVRDPRRDTAHGQQHPQAAQGRDGQGRVADVTPHRFRRTAATAINEIGGLQLASELLGHSDPSITREHYIRRNETVDPITAEFLENALGKAS